MDIQSHSYTHRTYQSTGDEARDVIVPPLSPQEIDEEISRSRRSIEHHLRARPAGLRTPMGNIRPFGKTETSVMESLERNGIRFVSSWLKHSQTEPNLPHDVQPFFYADVGFPELVEILGIGYYDVHLADSATRLLVLGEEVAYTPHQFSAYYINLLSQALRHQNKSGTVFVPFVFHPWAVAHYDPLLKIHSEILRFCASEGIAVKSYREIDEIMRKKKLP